MRKVSACFGALVGAAALGIAGTAPVGAATAATVSSPIVQGFAGPLQFAVGANGNFVVGQDFAGTLTVANASSRKDVVSRPGKEIAAVDVTDGAIVFGGGGTETKPASTLERRSDSGKVQVVADLLGFEKSHNPDHVNTYGFVPRLSQSCASQWPTKQQGPPTYTGIIDSHAYSVRVTHAGYFVGDAAGNDILLVQPSGAIRVVSVLPPQPHTITAAEAKANHAPACVAGHTYDFEPVPTDVEMGNDGYLYVSTLPGGPEGPSLGARGSVYKVNPSTGAAQRLATGLAGAVNVAVTPSGQVYATELFGGAIDHIVNGHAVRIATVKDPAGLEYANGKLYVSWDVMGNGKISTVSI
ncbi:MAG TPA: ScyD/ScyE family protein [Acidimicrobiia bacterium]